MSLDGYLHQASSRKFLTAAYKKFGGKVLQGPLGALCDFTVFSVFYCTGNIEPDLKMIKKESTTRFVLCIWDRVGVEGLVQGWREISFTGKRETLGVLDIRFDDYTKSWSETAQRYARKWNTQNNLYIEKTTREQYEYEYRKSTLSKHLQELFTKVIRDYAPVYKEDLVLYVVKSRHTNEILAGLAVLFDTETCQSIHLASFIKPEAKNTLAGFGIIVDFIRETKARGFKYVNLGVMYQQGDPKSWIGYSNFKKQFSPELVKHSYPLAKIIRK